MDVGLEWWFGDRPPLSGLGCEQLAERVDAELEVADRLLFTVTPREELDGFARWQRLADQGWCGLLRQVVAATARMSTSDRDFAGDELALSLGISSITGRSLVWEFGAIASLPGLVEAVERGRISQRHVKAFMRVLEESSLSLERRQAVALIALARFRGHTPGEWAALVRKLILSVDPAATAGRRAEQAAQRRCRFYPQPDEQGAMWLQAPVEQLARAQARLHAEAVRLKNAGDPRTMEQLQCDVALALLADGTLAGQPAAPYQVDVIVPIETLDGTRPSDIDTAHPGAVEAGTAISTGTTAGSGTGLSGQTEDDGTDGAVTGAGAGSSGVPAERLSAEDLLGEIPGWGAISAELARELAGQAGTFTQIVINADGQVDSLNDPVRADRLPDLPTAAAADAGGAGDAGDAADAGESVEPSPTDEFLTRVVIAMRRPPVPRRLSTDRYRPGVRLTRLLRARDRTCVFPGCHRPAAWTDLDHRDPWPRGGTTVENLQCLRLSHEWRAFPVMDLSTETMGHGRESALRRPRSAALDASVGAGLAA